MMFIKKKKKKTFQAEKKVERPVLELTKNIHVSGGATHAVANSMGQENAQHLESNTTIMDYSTL